MKKAFIVVTFVLGVALVAMLLTKRTGTERGGPGDDQQQREEDDGSNGCRETGGAGH